MDKDELIRKARDPNMIPGIYNYCDRWCERCPFTARCMNFTMSKTEPGVDHDLDSAAFWEQFTGTLAATIEMIEEDAREMGIDLNEVDVDDTMAELELTYAEAEENICSRMSMTYISQVDKWFADQMEFDGETGERWKNDEELDRPGDLEDLNIQDTEIAVEIIRWYQHFIYPKVMRAVEGKLHDRIPSMAADPDFPRDDDGSAKIALIALDRSLAAWGELYRRIPSRKAATMEILVWLEKIRHALEKQFPDARSFVRPGFDEDLEF